MTGTNYRHSIGQLISQLRGRRGLTQAQLAALIGTSQSAINRIERGAQNVSLDILAKLSEVLDSDIILLGSPNRLSLRITGAQPLHGTIDSTKFTNYELLALLVLNKLTDSHIIITPAPRLGVEMEIIESPVSLANAQRLITPINYEILSLLNPTTRHSFTYYTSKETPDRNIIATIDALATPGSSLIYDIASNNYAYQDFYEALKSCGAQIETLHEI